MAMFTLLEINNDHLSDLEVDPLGRLLAAIVRNQSNVDLLEAYGLHRAVRFIGQSGESVLHKNGFEWLKK
jgi:hypothetical protein